jgi:hypothetical protein
MSKRRERSSARKGRVPNSRGPRLSLLKQWYPPVTTLAARAAGDIAPALTYSSTTGAAASRISKISDADSIVSKDRRMPTTTQRAILSLSVP